MVEKIEELIRTPRGWLILVGIVFAVLMTNACHEGGHALVAWWTGDRRASIRRRATLNPVKHFHWLLTLVLPALSVWLFGWVLGGARPVMVDAGRIGPRRMALVALAGPMGNFLFCGAVIAGMGSAMALGWIDDRDAVRSVAWQILKPALWFSAFLGLINLMPVPPLDGSRIVAMFLPERARRIWYALAPLGVVVILFTMLWLGGQLTSIGLGPGHPEALNFIETKMRRWLFEMHDFLRGSP